MSVSPAAHLLLSELTDCVKENCDPVQIRKFTFCMTVRRREFRSRTLHRNQQASSSHVKYIHLDVLFFMFTFLEIWFCLLLNLVLNRGLYHEWSSEWFTRLIVASFDRVQPQRMHRLGGFSFFCVPSLSTLYHSPCYLIRMWCLACPEERISDFTALIIWSLETPFLVHLHFRLFQSVTVPQSNPIITSL